VRRVIGKLINDRYEILEKTGEGGMALVYKAHDTMLDRTVALKFLRFQYASDNAFVERFRREAQAAAKLSHPNVVNIFDVGEQDDKYYIVMEYIEGQNLKEKIQEDGLPSIKQTLDWFLEISRALLHAHNNEIVHCDIKPHNILITPDKKVKVTDFGIAKAVTTSTATHTETVIGSAHYFSPEQAKGGVVGICSDLYSLGIVFYEMLTGELPFKGDSPIVIALQHIQENPNEPVHFNKNIPDELNNIVLKLLEKNPQDRYMGTGSLIEDLEIVKDIYFGKNKEESAQEKMHDEENEDYSTSTKDNENDQEDMLQDTINFGLRGWNEESQDARKDKQKIKKQENKIENPDEKITEKNSEQNEIDKGNKGMKRSLKAVFIGAGLILLLGLIFGVFAIPGFLYVEDVEVPELTGIPFQKAREILQDEGLRINVYHRTHSDEVPPEHVISQFPESNTMVKEKRLINVVVSEGRALVTTPDLYGKSNREVRVLLDRLDLEIGEIRQEYSDEFGRDYIIGQSPESGNEIEKGSPVNIIVSRGSAPEWVEVPELTGLDLVQAQEIILEHGFSKGSIDYQYSFNYDADTIITHEPTTGKDVLFDSPIDLLVSKGPVVDVEDKREAVVGVRLPPDTLREQEVKVTVHDNHGERIVYKYNHEPGDSIDVDVISVGEAMVRVFVGGNLLREYQL